MTTINAPDAAKTSVAERAEGVEHPSAVDPLLGGPAEGYPEQNLDSAVWDENGMARHNDYVNDMHPTAKFHPYELPSHPVARANFPRHLIDADAGFAQSPMSDVPVDQRMAKGKAVMDEQRKMLEEGLAGMQELTERALSNTHGGDSPEGALEAQRDAAANPDHIS